MIPNKEAVELILAYVKEQAEQIVADANNAIDSYVESARNRLERTVKSIEAQANALDVILPLNLIEVIASGGFVRSKDIATEWPDNRLIVSLNSQDIFWEQGTNLKLSKGTFRLTLIAEPLKEEG